MKRHAASTIVPTQQPQLYSSLDNPQSGLRASSLQKDGIFPQAHMTVNLSLTMHTLKEIRHALIVTPDMNSCITVHTPHPTIPVLTKKNNKLQGMIRSEMDHTLSHIGPSFITCESRLYHPSYHVKGRCISRLTILYMP